MKDVHVNEFEDSNIIAQIASHYKVENLKELIFWYIQLLGKGEKSLDYYACDIKYV